MRVSGKLQQHHRMRRKQCIDDEGDMEEDEF